MLNPKQKQFAYLMATEPGINGTQAARRAGYAVKSAHVTASKLLRNDKVRAEIRKVRDQLRKILDMDQAEVIRLYKEIADASIEEIVTFGPVRRELSDEEEETIDDDGNKVIIKTVYIYAGVQVKDIKDVNPSTLRAIKKISQTANGISVEFHDKKDALAKLHDFMMDDDLPVPGSSPEHPLHMQGNITLSDESVKKVTGLVE